MAKRGPAPVGPRRVESAVEPAGGPPGVNQDRGTAMGQKVRPTGFRTGIMVDWLSHWYASKQDFSELLIEDAKIPQQD